MGACETKNINTNAQYYFTNIENYSRDGEVRDTVKLQPKLKNFNRSGSCIIELVSFTDPQKTLHKSVGKTENASVDPNTNCIEFQKFFVVEYFFEKEQPIEFRISGAINMNIKTTLPSIMGSRGQTWNKKLEGESGEILEVKGFSFKSKLTSTLKFDMTLQGNLFGKCLNYTIIAKGTAIKPANSLLYQSEAITTLRNQNKILFKQCTIPDIYIASDGKYENNHLGVEIFDAKHNRKLGEYSGALKQVINNNTRIALGPSASANLFVDAIKNYSFIDYLRGGMQINLWVAIDFTGSNGIPTLQNSLHYLGPNPNQYETAIRACGDIVAYYDYDQKFPCFGFGGKFYGADQVDHCFPLNGNMEDPEIEGIDGILETYRNVLKNTQLYGPTYFHYFINKLNETIKPDIAREDYSHYHVLMILTDGIIEDMDETIDALVEASYLPVSVIIIGIGNADFSNMDVLDADDEPLFDRNGRKADRDLVQFVPYKDFQNNGQKLAEQVLEEVPRQIVEFYQHKKIAPSEPIVNLQSSIV